MNKTMFLTALSFGYALTSTPSVNAYYEDNPAVILAGTAAIAIGGAALYGIGYGIGKACDFWGNPNPDHELTRTETIMCRWQEVMHLTHHIQWYGPIEEVMYDVCTKGIYSQDIYGLVYQLESRQSSLRDCLHYAKKSRHYKKEYRLHAQLEDAITKVSIALEQLKPVHNYLERHRDYKRLFDAEHDIMGIYGQELAVYNSYQYQPEYLHYNLYNIAQCHTGDAYAAIHYMERLQTNINSLRSAINNACAYPLRTSAAQYLLTRLQYIYSNIANSPSFISLKHQYAHYKAEKDRLERERQRLEYERLQANLERDRLEYERLRLERQKAARQNAYTASLEQEASQARAAEARAKEEARIAKQNAEIETKKAELAQEEKRLAETKAAHAERQAREKEEARQFQSKQQKKAAKQKAKEQEEEATKMKREKQATYICATFDSF